MSIKNLVLILAIVGNSANVWANENAAPPIW